MSSEASNPVEYNLRKLMVALQREGYARPGKLPPDRINDKPVNRPMKLHCLNRDCDAFATVNYAAKGERRTGLYNCRSCGVSGDAISLVLWFCGQDFDPDDELSKREQAGLAHIWAEKLLDIAPGKPAPDDEDDEPYVPSWAQ